MGRPAGPGASRGLARLHALLDQAPIYALASRALAPGARRAVLARIRAELAVAPAGRALDVGCGPHSWLKRAGVSAVCVDTSPVYVRALRRRGARALVARAEALPFRTGSFASVWSFGLLHHLSEDAARRAVAEAARVAAGGRLVVFDGVLPRSRGRRLLAWAVRRLDRGRFMRDETALRAVLTAACSRWRVSRFTYSWTGLEGIWCVR